MAKKDDGTFGPDKTGAWMDVAVAEERRRIVGIVLKRYAEAKLAGAMDIADALDKLATEIEHGA